MITLINPIDSEIKEAIKNSSSIQIAVPFLSYHTVKRLFEKKHLISIRKKQILIKLDSSHSISYDLEAIKHLLDCDFEVRFDNSIHLKLYILGASVFISSGNLTDGGLKNNFELTVQTNEKESKVQAVFDELWAKNKSNSISTSYIEQNWAKYLMLKKKFPREKVTSPIINVPQLNASEEELISAVLQNQSDWSWHYEMIGLVMKKRNKLFSLLTTKSFDEFVFYAPEGHKKRKSSLFYEFVYGNEEKLAGTGLREAQFKDVFTDSQFNRVIEYIFPQSKNKHIKWDLDDKTELLQFCKGLFEFKVRSFKEALPIRLVSYFYPEHFLPIFNLNHLGEMCNILGFEASSSDRATRLCEYNLFLDERLKDLPYNNFVKSTILYRLLYALKVKKEIDKNGPDTIEQFISSQRKEWIRNNMLDGLKIIQGLQ